MRKKSCCLLYEYRCDERLKTKNEESTRLTDTGLVVELEMMPLRVRFHFLKIVVVYYKSKARAKESIWKWVSV